MAETEIEKIKSCLKDMLKWFHNFCIENNIQYYALGGTLLGAMRHGGFIPWDDDVDLGLPRPDYEKLIVLMKNKLGRYILESPYDDADDFFFPYAKLFDTHTTAVMNNKYKTKRGLFIDVFPIDGVGINEEEAKRTYAFFDIKYNFYISRICGINKKRSKIKNLAVYISNVIPKCIINDKKLLQNICDECKKHNYESSLFCGNFVGAYHFREIVPKEYFGTPKMIKFEDFELCCPEKADEYLKQIYGDWHAIPDESQRRSHHDFLTIDIDNGYLL